VVRRLLIRLSSGFLIGGVIASLLQFLRLGRLDWSWTDIAILLVALVVVVPVDMIGESRRST